MNDLATSDSANTPEQKTSHEVTHQDRETSGGKAENPPTNKKPLKSTTPQIKCSTIYAMIKKSDVIDKQTVDQAFELINSADDPAILLSSLLKDSMNGVERLTWNELRRLHVPGRLFEKLCQVVKLPSLGPLWDRLAREESPESMTLLLDFVPATKDEAIAFLYERSMLPVSLLIYRSYRNDSEALGKVFNTWVSLIASGCLNHKQDTIEEALRASKWLIDISSKKSNPKQFLAEIAPMMVALRLGARALDDTDKLLNKTSALESQLTIVTNQNELMENQISDLRGQVASQQVEINNGTAKIAALEEKNSFTLRHATESESQSVGAMKQRLKTAIMSRTEDAKMFLDRPVPNIGEALNILSEIEEQFQ
jgi:hypothetical protein